MPAPVTVIPDRFKDFQVPYGPIGEPVYRRTYSQMMENGKAEDWKNTAVRAAHGNVNLVSPEFIEPGEEEKLQDLLMGFGILPAGRHLSSSGMLGRQFLFNCHGAGWDYLRASAHFTFLFDQLMQGGGVGGNYSNRYMHQMPYVARQVELHIDCRADHPNIEEFADKLSEKPFVRTDIHLQVEDSREGWVEAVETILDAAYDLGGLDPDPTVKMVIDVSDIRARGLPLKTSGGIACGPEPLVTMLINLVEELNKHVGMQLDSVAAMNVDHTLSSCVIAGGKRRSSRMSVKCWKDHDIFQFLACKAQDGAHWTTNISVEVDNEFIHAYHHADDVMHAHARAVMRAVTEGCRLNGEPGFWNIDLARQGEREPEKMFCPNPCGEIGLHMWENCNLGHINLQYFAENRISTPDMCEAFRLMTRWLIRATFGDIPNPRQRAVVNENRRIGVGFLGYHGWLALQGIRYSDAFKDEYVVSRMQLFKAVVDKEALSYSQQLGIPCPVKRTTLAPTGTTACLPGVSGSAQSIFAAWYKRLVRYSNMDPELAIQKLKGYVTFPDTHAPNTTIVEYWCEDPLVTKVRASGFVPEEIIEGQDEISLDTCLGTQAMLQEHWADNAISYTINIPVDRMPGTEEMEAKLVKYLPLLKGTTIFPDKTRVNAPLQRLTKEEWDAYSGLKEVVQVEQECVGGCPVK